MNNAYNGGMENMMSTETEAAPDFTVAKGYIIVENFEFPRAPTSEDAKYLKHFKMARSLKNTAYYTVRKHCALTPFGPFVSPAGLEALMEEMESIVGPGGAVSVFNDISVKLNLDLRCEVNLVYLRADGEQEVLRDRLKRFTVEMLLQMKADLLHGNLNQLTHKASPYNNLDVYCAGQHAAMLRAVYSSLKDQIAFVRAEMARGATQEEAGAKVDTRVIDEAIDLFRKST